MSKNRILSLCCCLPIAFSNVTALAMETTNTSLETPFVAELVSEKTRSIELVEFKDRKTSIDEHVQTYLEEQAELERQRIEREKEEARLAAIEEQRRKEEEERQYQKLLQNRIYVTFEVSFYTTAPDEGSGTGIGASGEYVQPWVSIALPRKTPDGREIPFYSKATIDGLGTFVMHDTGSYIEWAYNEKGNLVCRVDICVNSKQEAYSLGRFLADGYIDLYTNE